MPEDHGVFVSVPLGATEPRPVMVGMHGAGDRPEWACGGYRAATDAFPFILCPRGLSHGGSPEKYWSPGAARIEEDIASAVAALRARFGGHVADGPLLYAGFSLGAMHGAQVLADEPKLFSAALLVEGGYSELTTFVANTWSKGAGRRALLACGSPSCPAEFGRAEKSLRNAGIETRVLDARTGRHNLDGEMMKALRGALPWLVRDDPRWAPFVSTGNGGARP
jgi:predicted esterase